ncbi:hypothetical protein HDV03_000418 [Kappamyces sp. JEL0829]|nr:hypothetical protein HDV03_000418 [Kappamyces sp. JEL0829]
MFDSAAVSCLQSVFVALVLLNGLAASRRPSLEELKRLSLPSQNASQISIQNKNILYPQASVFSLSVRKAAVALPGQNGTLQNLYNGLLYIGEAVVGSGQKFMVDLDTGSSDTWFRGPNCTSLVEDGSCNGTRINVHDKLLTSTGKTWETVYGIGDVSGKIYTAPVSIAGLNATIPVGVSEVENAQGDIDGLIGLGFNGVDNSNIEAALDGKPANLFDAFGLKGSQNVFGFSFDHLGEGKFTFGGVDSSSWNGTPSYFPVLAASKTDYLGWIVDGSAVSVYVGGKKPLKPTPLGANGPSYVLVDTGTSAIILSEQVAKLVNVAIGSGDYDSQDGIWDIPCSVRDSGPEVILAFSPQGPYYHVPPSLYVWNDPEDTQYCQSQFMSGADMGDGSTLTILGDAFLQNYYSIYDKELVRVGFVATKATTAREAYPSTSSASRLGWYLVSIVGAVLLHLGL